MFRFGAVGHQRAPRSVSEAIVIARDDRQPSAAHQRVKDFEEALHFAGPPSVGDIAGHYYVIDVCGNERVADGCRYAFASG